MISEERYWTTVIIKPTHISQCQGSTAGAAKSSGLSRGQIPPDQGSIAGAATSSGLSRDHIPRDQGSIAGTA